MRYKVNSDMTFGGFFSDNVVDEYKIENTFAISEDLHKELIYKNNMEGYDLLIDSANKIFPYLKPVAPDDIVKPYFNNKLLKWEETATHEEKIQFWKDKMISSSKEMTTLRDIGLEGSGDYIKLQVQLEKYREYYMTASHELALEINSNI